MGLFRHPKRRIKKLLADGEYDEAITFGRNLEPKYADDHDFMFIMGSAFFIVEDTRQALQYFERALELDDSDVETLTLKADVHWSLGQKKEVVDCCSRILEIEPKNSKAIDRLEKLKDV